MFSTWFVSTLGTVGSFLLIVTYVHISRLAVQRKKTLRKQGGNRVDKGSSKSINTLFLSVSLTVAFVVCNLFQSIYSYMYLLSKNFVHVQEVGYIEYLLLNINCAVNPMLYTIVEFIHARRIYKSKNKEQRTTAYSTSQANEHSTSQV